MKRTILSIVVIVLSISLTSCLPTPTSGGIGSKTITVYGFSIMKESLAKEIYPAFSEKWNAEHNGEEITFQSSFAGSETVPNQILQGARLMKDANALIEVVAPTSSSRDRIPACNRSARHGGIGSFPYPAELYSRF